MASALVTGGTSGIGRAFADELAGLGYDLVLVARDSARLDATACALRAKHGVDVELLVADLADLDQVRVVAARLSDDTRPVDVLVNNAGFGLNARLLDPNVDRQLAALNVMVNAVLMLSAAAGRAMTARGRGLIINVGSVSAWIVKGNYSAIKAWVLTFTQALAAELAGSGVHALVVCPGWVNTEFHQRAGVSQPKLPGWVWLQPADVARTALADAKAGRVVSVPKTVWKVAAFVLRHCPAAVPRKISRMISRSREVV